MTKSKPATTDKKLAVLTVYEIQAHTLCNGWVNMWMYEDRKGNMRPETFPNREAAQAALEEYLMDLDEEASLGNISRYDREEFRIRAVPLIATVEAEQTGDMGVAP